LQELTFVPNSKLRTTSVLEGDENTSQQQKHDPNKNMKLAEEECDQSDLQLANCIGFVAQPINHSPLGFEAQTKKLSR
jgi:hypothetical protein